MSSRVYLGALPENVSTTEVHKYLSMYGQILEIKLRQGFGFVQFDSAKDALDVVRTFGGRPFLGADVKVQLARPDRRVRVHGMRGISLVPPTHSSLPSRTRSSRSTENSRSTEKLKTRFPVLITGLNCRTTEQELKDFGRLLGGEIAYCGIDTGDRTRRFLDFTLEEDAERAVKELSGQALLGKIVQLTHYAARRGETSITQPMRSRSRSPVRTQRQPSITSPGPRSEDCQDQRHYERCSWDRVLPCSWDRDDSVSAYGTHNIEAAMGDSGRDASAPCQPNHVQGLSSRMSWTPDLRSHISQLPMSNIEPDTGFRAYL